MALVFLNKTPQHLPLQPHLILLIQPLLHTGAPWTTGTKRISPTLLSGCTRPALSSIIPALFYHPWFPPTFSPIPGAAQDPLPQQPTPFSPVLSLLSCITRHTGGSLTSLRALKGAWAWSQVGTWTGEAGAALGSCKPAFSPPTCASTTCHGRARTLLATKQLQRQQTASNCFNIAIFLNKRRANTGKIFSLAGIKHMQKTVAGLNFS